MENKDFENYLNNVEFDDRPDHTHRDKLEKKLIVSLSEQSRKEKVKKVKFNWALSRIAAAAVIIIGIFIGIISLNGTNAWAEVIKAFNKVENVHMTQTLNMQDGSIDKHEIWIRMPDCLYEDGSNRTIIDNGIDRLTLDRENKEAQFSDSFMPYKSISEHYVFDNINIFRDDKQKNYELKKLDNESTEKILVFSLKFIGDLEDLDFEGKAWVDAKTMLPIKIQAELKGEPKEGNPISGEVVCDYGAIPDSAFAMEIPEGFTELPRKQKGVLSGTVLDENGNPVAGATVFATDRAGQFSKKALTDKSGNFIYNLPPDGVGTPVWLPIMFRAYEVNVPDKVAWTIIKDPQSREVPGGNIPYEVASIENDGCILRSANGITLRMEQAGTIAGRITDIDGNPLSDVKVKLLRYDLSDQYGNAGMTGIDVLFWNGRDEKEGVVRTDENGRYEINNLPKFWKRTKVFVQAQADGYTVDTSYFYADGPIEYKEVDFQLYKSSLTVHGVLTNNYGEPIAEAPILVIINGKEYLRNSIKTDENGKFIIEDCPDTPELQIKAELIHKAPYYPNVTIKVGYENGKKLYEVEMIAEKPELIIEVTIKDSSGGILPDFPVEVRSDPGEISSQWKADKKLTQRTDKNGYCKFTDVPNVKGLKLVFSGVNHVWNDTLNQQEKEKIKRDYSKYKWTEVPVELIPDQKEYKVNVTILTNEETQR